VQVLLDLRALAGQPVLEGALPPAQGVPGVTIRYRRHKSRKATAKDSCKGS